ncbi:phage tail assembly chaperone [Rhizobiaceae bacterium LC148]|nr:phage tail assembly chaperone [Rhizobiaceae bacterium LC148]
MKSGLGALGWRPSEFWSATITEFFQAIEGWNLANGVKPKTEAPSEDEVEALARKYGG